MEHLTMPRIYFGHVGVNKVNQGTISVNANLDSDQALDLALALAKASKLRRSVDINFFIAKRRKTAGKKIPQGKIPTTVTVFRPSRS